MFGFRSRPPPSSAKRIQRERIQLAMADGREIEVERVRDPRARRIKLLVGENGVRLTVPRGASLAEAQTFLHLHRDWLDGQLNRQRAHVVGDVLTRGVTDGIPLRGQHIPLRWQSGRYAHLGGQDPLTEAGLTVVLPDAAPDRAAQRLIREFYLAEARKDVGRWLPRWMEDLPRPPREMRLRPLRSLWGSLSPDDAVSLDLSLVLGRPEAFEYVLVHELCHLLHRNHSPAFWNEVSLRVPDWRVHRAYLRGEGMALKPTLAALLHLRRS